MLSFQTAPCVVMNLVSRAGSRDEIVDVDSGKRMGLEACALKPRRRFVTERGKTVPKFQPRHCYCLGKNFDFVMFTQTCFFLKVLTMNKLKQTNIFGAKYSHFLRSDAVRIIHLALPFKSICPSTFVHLLMLNYKLKLLKVTG